LTFSVRKKTRKASGISDCKRDGLLMGWVMRLF
jgi:hypothetical protein